MVLEKIDENVLKLSGDVTLHDIYARFPEYELPVEPLGSRKPLSEFISSGGFGYGSLREGPFNSKIFRIKWKRPKYSFSYGLKNSTLYAAGYPLHRITAALPHELYNKSLGEIQEVVIPVRDKEEVKVDYEPKESADFHVPPMARDVLFVNDRAASVVGLPGQGKVVMYRPDATPQIPPNPPLLKGGKEDLPLLKRGKEDLPLLKGGKESLPLLKEGEEDLPLIEGETHESGGGEAAEFLQRRFIEDRLNGDQVFRVLTQKSGAAKLYELAGADNLFFALVINIGLLVMVSGEGIREQLAEMPLTYVI
jgi:hypothetical protein